MFSLLTGGRLFSKLHKVRSERAKEHPECFSPGQHRIKMKHSYTSPSICTENHHNTIDGSGTGASRIEASDEGPVSPPTSWDETLQRLDACGTHSYIEETGCLQNKRPSHTSLLARLERPSSLSCPVKTPTKPHIHPPAPSLCLHPLTTQEKPALPLSCARVNYALDVMSDPHGKAAGMGLIECSSDFEVAWNSSDPARSGEGTNPFAVADTHLDRTSGQSVPLTSPAILHLASHCQTQIPGMASWLANGLHQGSVLSGEIPENTTCSLLADTAPQRSVAPEQESRSPTTEEQTAMVVVKSTDRVVFSEYRDTVTPSASPLCQGTAGKQDTRPGMSMALSGVKSQEAVEEAWELVSPGGKDGPPRAGSLFSAPWTVTQSRRGDMDAFLKSEGSEGQGEDQVIEVDGWCHLPRFPQESSKAKETAIQVFWGLPEKEVRVWGAQILLALESLHQQGILCRDLNPRNVLLTSNGESCCVSLFTP